MRDKVFNRPDQKIKRKILRENLTVAETIMWNNLKSEKLGVKFVRQYSVKALHEYDLLRDNIISFYGIKIVRFTNEEVINNILNL